MTTATPKKIVSVTGGKPVIAHDIMSVAKTGGFDLVADFAPKPGHVYTVTRAISARVNQNFDGFPSEELKRAYKTFLGKPLFVNHTNDNPHTARGRVVGVRYVENGVDKFIEVIQEVNALKFPKLAKELVEGGLDSVSMGCSAERTICSYCGNEASSMFDMCAHVLNSKGQVLHRQGANGMEKVLVYEECRDIGFFELSYVFDPADETAVVSNVVMANRRKQALGPSDQEKIDNAEKMFGTGSPQHEKAKKRFAPKPAKGKGGGSGQNRAQDGKFASIGANGRTWCDLPGCRRWTTKGGPDYDQEWIHSNGELRTYDFCCDGHEQQYQDEFPSWAFEATVRNPIKAHFERLGFGEVEAPAAVDTLRDEGDEDTDDFHRYVESPDILSEPDLDMAKDLDRLEDMPPGFEEYGDDPMDADMPIDSDGNELPAGPMDEELPDPVNADGTVAPAPPYAPTLPGAEPVDEEDGSSLVEPFVQAPNPFDPEAPGPEDEIPSDEQEQPAVPTESNPFGEEEPGELAPDDEDPEVADAIAPGPEDDEDADDAPPAKAKGAPEDLDPAQPGPEEDDPTDVPEGEVPANEVAPTTDESDEPEEIDPEIAELAQQLVEESGGELDPDDALAYAEQLVLDDAAEAGPEEDQDMSTNQKRRSSSRRVAVRTGEVYQDKKSDDGLMVIEVLDEGYIRVENMSTGKKSYMQSANLGERTASRKQAFSAGDKVTVSGDPTYRDGLAGTVKSVGDPYITIDADGQEAWVRPENLKSARRRKRADFNSDYQDGESSFFDYLGELASWPSGTSALLSALEDFVDEPEGQGVSDEVFDNLYDNIESNSSKFERSANRRAGNRSTSRGNGQKATRQAGKARDMARSSLAQRGRVASRGRTADQSRNDQGDDEKTFITQTPPEEGVVAPDGDSKINNSEESLVARIKADRAALIAMRNRKAGRRKRAGSAPVGADVTVHGRPGTVVEDLGDGEVVVEFSDGSDDVVKTNDLIVEGSRRRRAAEQTPTVVNPEQSGTSEDLKGDFESADPNDGVQETQPKDASRRAARTHARFNRWARAKKGRALTAANSPAELRSWARQFAAATGTDISEVYPVIRRTTLALRKRADEDKPDWLEDKIDGDDDSDDTKESSRRKRAGDVPDAFKDQWDDEDDSDKKESRRRRATRRKTADDKLDVAAPDGRVDVEAPTSGTTDDEAQASQFDKSDFGSNAGDDLADPDLSTDQNFAPGEGKKSSREKTASGLQAVRLAEAYIAAGLDDKNEGRWTLSSKFERMSSATVADRTALLERVIAKHRLADASERKTAGTRGVTSANTRRSPIPQNLPSGGQVQQREAAASGNSDSDLFL